MSALPEELDFLEEYLQDRDGWKKTKENTYVNAKQRLEIVSKVFGVGKVSAAYGTADLINETDPDLIINVGYAGGLIKEAVKGDVAIGTDYVQVDFVPFFNNNIPQTDPSPVVLVDALEKEASKLNINGYKGRIATGDFFLHSTDQKNKILEEYSPIAFDMESAAVAQVATAKKGSVHSASELFLIWLMIRQPSRLWQINMTGKQGRGYLSNTSLSNWQSIQQNDMLT